MQEQRARIFFTTFLTAQTRVRGPFSGFGEGLHGRRIVPEKGIEKWIEGQRRPSGAKAGIDLAGFSRGLPPASLRFEFFR